MAKTGFPYYRAETDRFQDIKIKRLKKRFHSTGYAVYQYILNEIYRVQGCYLPFGEDEIFEAAEYWGLDEIEVQAVTDFCCEIGLFDAGLYKSCGVLTGRSIQSRYVEMCKMSKRKVIIPEKYVLISSEETDDRQPDPQPSQPATQPSQPAPEPSQPATQPSQPATQPSQPAPKNTPAPKNPENSGKTAKNSGKKRETPEKQSETPENSNIVEYSIGNIENIPPSTPSVEEEEKAPPLSSGGNSGEYGNLSAEEYRKKLEHLSDVCRSLGCIPSDLRKILLIEGIAHCDSPIWGLIDEMRNSGGKYSFEKYVVPSLANLIVTGRLRMMEAKPKPVVSEEDIKMLLAGIGIPSYDIDEICERAAGKEQALQDAIKAVKTSRGKILMPSIFIRSKLEKVRAKDRNTA